MSYRNITDDSQLQRYCLELAESDSIAFDTEFVSEDSYLPVLCLVQVTADGESAVIDALAIDDMTPFWEALAKPGHETIVHAGRSEMEFCLQSIGHQPGNVFDVQIAAGLAGLEYPIGYGKLLTRLLGQKPQKHETRTDWRRRPLSNRQIQYALDDARYLHPVREILGKKLESLGRSEWLRDEMATWQSEIELAHSHQRWRRVSGSSGLTRHSLAIVRELWQWREDEARRRDKPVRWVLRDDLIVELAKRGTADEKRIRAVRGLERGDLRRRIGELAAAIQRALELPEDECPDAIRRDQTPPLSVLGQFLFSALACICRQAELAPNLVGTPNDIRELVASRTQGEQGNGRQLPKLARGWRGEFVGRLFDDLLAGRMSIRVDDPTSEHPLVLEEYPGK